MAVFVSPTVADRLWPRVDVGDCWEWQGATTRGYGVIWTGGRPRQKYTHVVAWELLVGPVPAGLELDHKCRNKRCVNPDHLEPVTHRTNTLRGYSNAAQRARQRHCKRGHPFDAANTHIRVSGYRQCRVCAAMKRREARQWR